MVGVVAVTVPAFLSALVARGLFARRPQARVRWQGRAFQWWSRSLCRVLGVRVRVSGPPPAPPFLLVANHTSYLDILVLGTRVPCVFVAKAEIDGWPVFGALCRSVNTIFVDRTSKRDLTRVIAQMEAMLAAGQGVVIFPEGTSSAGHEVLPFRSSLLELPARIDRPVHWAALSYAVPAGSPPVHLAVTWWGDMPLGTHLWELAKLDHVEASLTFGPAPAAHGDRKQLADTLWRAIAGAFVPMVDKAEIDRLLDLRERDPAALPKTLRGSRAAAGRERP
jgi:1-acyl-sn-glycerol-3-phosphate acyltransferase